MVIYLEEAVARKEAAMATPTVRGLHVDVMEGALLRLGVFILEIRICPRARARSQVSPVPAFRSY